MDYEVSMLKKIFICLLVLGTIITSLSLIKIEKKDTITIAIEKLKEKGIPLQKVFQKEEPVGKIKIPKIHLEKPLYDITSEKNNIEENVTILKGSTSPEEKTGILFIAAHSGTGEVAFFEELDELKIDDTITIEYKKKSYTYQVENIYEQPKNGYITGRIEEKPQLVLTTCCPNKENCQLIIHSTKIES